MIDHHTVITIVGLGLLGGSYAQAFARAGMAEVLIQCSWPSYSNKSLDFFSGHFAHEQKYFIS